MKNIGDRITVKAHPVLGTDEVQGTIRAVFPTYYIVHCDGDDEEWDGPVSLDGEILVQIFP